VKVSQEEQEKIDASVSQPMENLLKDDLTEFFDIP